MTEEVRLGNVEQSQRHNLSRTRTGRVGLGWCCHNAYLDYPRAPVREHFLCGQGAFNKDSGPRPSSSNGPESAAARCRIFLAAHLYQAADAGLVDRLVEAVAGRNAPPR